MTIHLRADRALFRFSGPDAHKLLNDVVTGHIPPADDGVAAWWALLSPQGKILAEGLAGWLDEALWIDVHESVADDFFKRMRLYRLRAKAEIEDLRETHRVGFSAETVPGGQRDRLGPVQLGWRVIAPIADTAAWVEDDSAYHAARIAAGILHQGNDFPANDAFAHDLGMDLLEGIDFVKGCYVGQEVVSRMKHRGTARRRPVIVSGLDAPAGSAIVAGNREAGTIGQVVDDKAVAILRLDRLTDPDAVRAADKIVTLELPAWANYQFGGPETDPSQTSS
ncbi:folate-binding protein [Devosia sp. YIM 151766]|uniref:CAF17-like 4Fe-4S cluster assembly/insertion protein YgfZ n=1 Tax=Devosia sp. YIM 151766 TaxID=3017325 RepID=UPI00255C3012|nr:folate-binding protein [Devosia sp. YIM 151766]WIY53536.1 folate-binding protein [Devosia sp. YIM 151766]